MLYILGPESMSAILSVLAVNILPFVPVDIMKMILSVLLGLKIKNRIKV